MKRQRLIAGVLTLAMISGLCSAQAKQPDRSVLPVSGGNGHSVALSADGTVYCWGANRLKQLGIKELEDSSKPVKVELPTAISVSAGYDFTAALTYTGNVYTWGMGRDDTPVEVAGLNRVAKIDAGQTDILALRSDGTVWQWTYGFAPAQVVGLAHIVDISAGGGHNLALSQDGYIYAWGSNTYGQLGNGTTTDSAVPVKLPLLNVTDISAGFSHSVAATYDGCVYAWGSNEYGQLGDGSTTNSTQPVKVKSLTKVVNVAAGNSFSMALNEKGNVSTWGYGEFGQLGNGSSTITQSTPVTVSGRLSDVKYIECGIQHCMAVTENGSLYIWGRNRDGQLGNSGKTNCDTPQRVWEKVYVGGEYQPEAAAGASSWAVAEINALYDSELVFPLLWGQYSSRITRAEFASLLVSLYENVKNTTPSESSSSKYTDIKGHPLESGIRKAITLGLLSGTSDTTISPDNTLTRQECVKILHSFISKVRSSSANLEKLPNLSFYVDAKEIASWAAPYVYYAYENNIMRGDSSNCFKPLDGLTREQALVIVQRMVVKYEWNK